MADNRNLSTEHDLDKIKELEAFRCVKELSDAGVTNIPKIFVRPSEELIAESKLRQIDVQIPVIDMTNIEMAGQRDQIVKKVLFASEKWGFFQVINHGIPQNVLNDMIGAVQVFHEQDVEFKKKFYSSDITQKVLFNFNYDLYRTRYAIWRDTLSINMLNQVDPKELPVTFRRETLEFRKHMEQLGDCLIELLSEALGLTAEHLKSLGYSEEYSLACHYYPACPEPELTLGAHKHTDPDSFTVLMQNQISSLQVFYEDQFINVQLVPGALLVNIGEFLQMLSNGRFKSVEHRVIANSDGPRISVGCFFRGNISRAYGPIKELISENNPPLYKEVASTEYLSRFFTTVDGSSTSDYYKI